MAHFAEFIPTLDDTTGRPCAPRKYKGGKFSATKSWQPWADLFFQALLFKSWKLDYVSQNA
jgi:hypothetical protein